MLVLLKAPWVGITLDPAAARRADNQLSGRISHIECGSGRCEVLMTRRTVKPCAPPCHRRRPLASAEGTEAIAYFNADRIILATLC